MLLESGQVFFFKRTEMAFVDFEFLFSVLFHVIVKPLLPDTALTTLVTFEWGFVVCAVLVQKQEDLLLKSLSTLVTQEIAAHVHVDVLARLISMSRAFRF